MSAEAPPGVEPLGPAVVRRSDHGLEGVDDISVAYSLASQWEVRLTAVRSAGFGTVFTRVEFASLANAGESINSQALRLVPFRHAKAWVDSELVKVVADDEVGGIPSDYSNSEAYAQLAISYDWFVERFPDRPLIQLAGYSGMNRNTLSARIDRAKALGFLARESTLHPFRATNRAFAAVHANDAAEAGAGSDG